jgi:hypothetical protein
MMPILTIIRTRSATRRAGYRKVLDHISTAQYFSSAWNGLSPGDILGGLIKPLVFSDSRWWAATADCEPRAARESADPHEAVNASVLILLFDFLLTKAILSTHERRRQLCH